MFDGFYDALIDLVVKARFFDVVLVNMFHQLPEAFTIFLGCGFVLLNLSFLIKFFKGWL